VAGIDGEWREHWKDLRLEIAVDRAPLRGGKIADVKQAHVGRLQLLQQIRETSALQR
jgi:hypothetical protein